MNRAVTVALLSVATLLAAPAPALGAGRAGGAGKPGPAGPQQPDVKAMIERNKRCLREASAHASKVTFDRKDLERYLAEYRSFDALELDKKDDANGPSCPDLAEAVKDRRYVAWARERGLDPKVWMQKSLRIALTDTKRRAPAQAAEMKAQMETQKRELAKHCKSMGPTACADMDKAFAQGDEMVRESAAMMALLPEPTKAEAALLAEYDARIRETTEGARRERHGPGGEPGPDADAADAPDEPPPGK